MNTIKNIITTKAFNEVSLVGNAKVVKFVTLEQLINVLSNTTLINNVSTFAQIVQLTEPKVLKKCRDTKEPFNNVLLKLSKVNVLLNSEYEKNVTNQLEREDKEKSDYQKGQNTMPIEKCENNNFFGTFRGNAVIEYRPNPNVKIIPKSSYFYDMGNELVEVEKSNIPNVLPISNHATNQGTDKEILWRKLYVNGIVSITLNGVTYQRL